MGAQVRETVTRAAADDPMVPSGPGEVHDERSGGDQVLIAADEPGADEFTDLRFSHAAPGRRMRLTEPPQTPPTGNDEPFRSTF